MEDNKESENKSAPCPICNKNIPLSDIEAHANKCIFLNCEEPEWKQKRKRSISPLPPTQVPPKKSPRLFKQNPAKENENPAQSSSRSAPTETKKPLAPMFQAKTSKTPDDDEEPAKLKLSSSTPLAKQLAPKSLDDFFGQNHVLGKNTVLRNLIDRGEIPNMILWGPPGCGKTSLSSIVQEICKHDAKLRFVSLCAATCGVKEVQSFVTQAKNEQKFGRKTVLFMDEIHRFNKRQQDTFLLCVEKGEITLIGATTENPSFAINAALLSRCRVIVMQKLEPEDLYSILEKAADSLDVDVVDVDGACKVLEGYTNLAIENSALKWLADISDGDARIALGNLELTLQHCRDKKPGSLIQIDDIKDGIKKSHMLYDRAGEEHYNIISAMHKSIRGSDENAALYWTTRMIVSGENPLFIARRLVRAASEDIGNADPNALPLAVATMQGCQLLGMPESDVLLAQCAIYLARAPKSREADSALAAAKRVITECKGLQPAVPLHIRNAPTKLMKELGYGKLQQGEQFAFMPKELRGVDFFN